MASACLRLKSLDPNVRHLTLRALAGGGIRGVLVVRLPGGRVLAWRSTVNHLSGEATRAFLTVLEAVDEALATAGKDELVIRDCSRDQYLSPGDLANRSAFRFTEDSP